MLQLTVSGVPFIYYGEEIGMENHEVPLHEGLDPIASHYRFVPDWLVATLRKRGILLNRDECRAPMQWDSGPNAGFSSGTPWLPVHPKSPRVNVAAQEGDPESLLSCYRSLLAVRRGSPALQGRTLEWIEGAAPVRRGRVSPDARGRGRAGAGGRLSEFLRAQSPARLRGVGGAGALLEPARRAEAGATELHARRVRRGRRDRTGVRKSVYG